MTLSRLFYLVAGVLLVGLVACDGNSSTPAGLPDAKDTRADASTTLHRDCGDGGACSGPDTCERREHPEGAVETCEVRCSSDSQCPRGHRCHAAPCIPDDVMCLLCAPEDD